MIKKLHINESFDFNNLNRFVGKDFKTFYEFIEYYCDSHKSIEFGDTDGGDNGYVIFSIDDRELKVVYEWVWDDNSGLFTKGYKSGKILSVTEV